MPLLLPTVDTRVRLRLRDYNFGKSHRTLQEWTVSLEPVLRAEPGAMQLTWLHLYGPSDAAKKKDNFKLKRYEYHSEWHGRLLIGLRVEKPDGRGLYAIGGAGAPNKALPERPLQRALTLEAERRRPEEALYQARLAVLCGTGIDAKDVCAAVEVQLGEFVFSQTPCDAYWRAAVREGQATFQAPSDATSNEHASGVLRRRGERYDLRLPRDASQLPDVILYVLKGGKRAFYARFKAKPLVDAPFKPLWVHLEPCASSGKVLRSLITPPPPSLLVSLALARVPDAAPEASAASASHAEGAAASGGAQSPLASSPPNVPPPGMPGGRAGWYGGQPPGIVVHGAAPDWTDWWPSLSQMPPRGELTAYELRVHCYMARDLPAQDENGALDPFLVCSFSGMEAMGSPRLGEKQVPAQTQTLHATAFPSWCVLTPRALSPSLSPSLLLSYRLLSPPLSSPFIAFHRRPSPSIASPPIAFHRLSSHSIAQVRDARTPRLAAVP